MRYLPLDFLLLCTALTSTVSAAHELHESHRGEGLGARSAYSHQDVRVPREDWENLQTAYRCVMLHATLASPTIPLGERRVAALPATAVRADEGERGVAISTLKLESETMADIAAVADRIRVACDTGGLVELDFSGLNLHSEWVESLITVLTHDDMRTYYPKIVRINLRSNWIDGLGLQYLIPLLRLPTLKIIDISSNAIDSEQIENFGSIDAYDRYTPASEHILLAADERELLLSKVIWIPRSFFGATADKNPSGACVTPEVILRHRKYFGLPY